MKDQTTSYIQSLQEECPGVDFSIPKEPYDKSFTVGDYIIQYLTTTWEILKNSQNIKTNKIMDFVKADFKDFHLPIARTQIVKYLQCTEAFADDFMEAQSIHFAVSFNQMEFKKLSKFQAVPFKEDFDSQARSGDFGDVIKVYEGKLAYAKKTIRKSRKSYDDAINEINILEAATKTENNHLLRLRCAYEQDDTFSIITFPWCDLDLQDMFTKSHNIKFWTSLKTKKERIVLISNWMSCLASGLTALHSKIKHRDLKPRNILIHETTDGVHPIICDFGLSKEFKFRSTSYKQDGTYEYFSPEQIKGDLVGRKGDVFSLGIIFAELGLLLYGLDRTTLKKMVKIGYSELSIHLDAVASLFTDITGYESWCNLYRSLIREMLIYNPDERPKASAVWAKSKELVERVGGVAHCSDVCSPGTQSFPGEIEDDYAEFNERESIFSMV
ncbi:hypothetical protein HK103_006735 [Boothiomyces macroporosus]|uniref:Protein kinase domain-containing protein n=1 Tax=Boothiomyces macroporosus TaxID=261099 RepID=A0AAD5UDD9_9FUNG|nr:hypothetical protein HK103_006735 [Boothiomyces macroporosus]